jgi:glucose dehydrogenase
LNSDPLSTAYAPLDQINKDNFKTLKIAWRWKAVHWSGAVLARRHGAEQWRSNARDLSQRSHAHHGRWRAL